MSYALRHGDRGLEVQLVKLRLDGMKNKISIASSPAGSTPTWGPSHPSSNVYDTIMYWNVAAFQTLVNHYLTSAGRPIKVDGIYGPETQWCLAVAENWIADIIGRGAQVPAFTR